MVAQSWRIDVAGARRPVATRAQMARSRIERMVGLLRHDRLEDGEGLILPTCRSIHTAFMRFPIDVVFVDGRGVVVRIWKSLPPWRITPVIWRAQTVIELPAGTASRSPLSIGDQLIIQPASNERDA